MSIKKDTWVEKLVPNVNEVPSLEVISGYIGSGKSDDYIRIYQNQNLSSFIEVPLSDVVHSEKRNSKDNPLGGSIVWIKKDSEVDVSYDRGKSSKKGNFLETIDSGGQEAYNTGWYCSKVVQHSYCCAENGNQKANWYTQNNEFSCDCTTYDECTNGPVCKTVKTQCGATFCEETCSNLKTCNPNNLFCKGQDMGPQNTGWYCSKVVQHSHCCAENGNPKANWYTQDNEFTCDCTTYDECTNGPVCRTVRTQCGATLCEETCSGLKTCNPNNIFCRDAEGNWGNRNHPFNRRRW